MAARILELIDKSDNFELVRDEIAAILTLESENQQTLAAAASEEARLWKLRVFAERSTPWSEWESSPEQADQSPIVNVWFDNATIQLGASDIVERQRHEGIFNIDCYGYGVSEETEGEYEGELWHTPGDERAAREVQRAARLVRNILHAAAYTYLNMRGVVARRYVQSINAFQPAIGDKPVQRIQAVRLALHVEFNEFSPQITGQPLELISLLVKRKETGQLYFAAEYGDEDS
jgi:hypothetical protein